MKMVTLSSLVVLFAIASMVAIAPDAFAAHHEATVTNAPGSSTPGCEPECFIPSTVTIDVGGTVTWENNDTAGHTSTSGSQPGVDEPGAFSIVTSAANALGAIATIEAIAKRTTRELSVTIFM